MARNRTWSTFLFDWLFPTQQHQNTPSPLRRNIETRRRSDTKRSVASIEVVKVDVYICVTNFAKSELPCGIVYLLKHQREIQNNMAQKKIAIFYSK